MAEKNGVAQDDHMASSYKLEEMVEEAFCRLVLMVEGS